MNDSDVSSDALAELLTLTVEVDEDGDIEYHDHLGQVHRVHGPAVIAVTGTRYWYQNNQLHRDGGPAIEYTDGTTEWYQHNQRHRTDGPAVVWFNGDEWWYLNGVLQSEKEFHERPQSL